MVLRRRRACKACSRLRMVRVQQRNCCTQRRSSGQRSVAKAQLSANVGGRGISGVPPTRLECHAAPVASLALQQPQEGCNLASPCCANARGAPCGYGSHATSPAGIQVHPVRLFG